MVYGHCNKANAKLLRAHNTMWHRGAAALVSSSVSSLCCMLVCRSGKSLQLASKIRGDMNPWRRCVFLWNDYLGHGFYIPTSSMFDVKHLFRLCTSSRRTLICSILASFLGNLVPKTQGIFPNCFGKDI